MSEAKTLAFSEGAYNRGVNTATDDVRVPAPQDSKSISTWIGGPTPSVMSELQGRKPAAAPSISVVTPVDSGRVEGTDLDGYRGGGLLQTVRAPTGEIIGNRDIEPNDLIDIVTNSGRQMTVKVRQAAAEGFIHIDPTTGKYVESNRAEQQKAFDALQKLAASKRDSEKVKYASDAEQAIQDISQSMTEVGLSFGDTLAEFIGDNAGAPLNEPATQWAQANGLDMRENLQNYLTHMREAVDSEVLQPSGIDMNDFLGWIETNGLVRGRAVKAALFAHHMKNLDGFRSLAREYLDTAAPYRHKRS